MNRPEAVMLCRFVKACCPQQAMDEYTPDSWFELLSDLRFADAKEAATDVARRQPFVAPAEIRVEVARIRSERVARAQPFDPPPDLPGDELAYRRWLAEVTKRAADGEYEAPVVDLPRRDMAAIDSTFREVPDA